MKDIIFILFSSLLVVSLAAPAPGGFIEKSHLESTRRDTFDLSFVPSTRGAFTFPAPYNTRGYRITDESDGKVEANGYSYWAKINNHEGSDTMYIVAALNVTGGMRATVFSIDKTTEEVKKMGTIYNTSGLAYGGCESWFFSYTQPTKMFIPDWNKLIFKDILTLEEELVFDTTNYMPGTYAWQLHSSMDEKRFSMTLRSGADYSTIGCAVYFSHNNSFILFDGPEFSTDFDECQIDKSGQYLLIKANIDQSYDVEGIFINLDTGEHVTMLDQDGAPGHSDNGFGTLVSNDNWAPVGCRFIKYDFQPIINGAVRENLTIVYDTDSWANSAGCPQHLSWTNAKDPVLVPYKNQFMCGSNAGDDDVAKNNEVLCFRLDASLDVLIVAPVMSFMNASGGGDGYGKLPKAVLDHTGEYILWSSNMRSDRLDIFVARVPYHLLVAEKDYNPSATTYPPSAPNSGPQPSGAMTGANFFIIALYFVVIFVSLCN